MSTDSKRGGGVEAFTCCLEYVRGKWSLAYIDAEGRTLYRRGGFKTYSAALDARAKELQADSPTACGRAS